MCAPGARVEWVWNGGWLVRTVARDVERVDLGGHRAIDDADCVHVGYVPVGELAVGAACEQLALVGVVHDGFEEVGGEECIHPRERLRGRRQRRGRGWWRCWCRRCIAGGAVLLQVLVRGHTERPASAHVMHDPSAEAETHSVSSPLMAMA